MTDSAILKKLKKLLNLSECKTGNLNEKAAAAEKAAALMAEHKISMAEVMTADESVEADPIGARVVHESLKTCIWRAILLNGLCEANNCILLSSWKGLVAAGQDSDVQTVSYLFKVFENDIDRLCKGWSARYKIVYKENPGRSASRSFRIGAADAIATKVKMAATRVKKVASETALVRLDDIKKRVEDTFNAQKDKRKFTPPTDDMARFEGHIAGNSVKVDRTDKNLEAKKAELGGAK